MGLSRTLSWRIRNVVGASRLLTWRIRNAVGGSRTLRWAIASVIRRAGRRYLGYSTQWDDITVPSPTGISCAIAWRIANHVGRSRRLYWQIDPEPDISDAIISLLIEEELLVA